MSRGASQECSPRPDLGEKYGNCRLQSQGDTRVHVREHVCACVCERERVTAGAEAIPRGVAISPQMLTQSSVPHAPESPSRQWDVPTEVTLAELGLESGPSEHEGHGMRMSRAPLSPMPVVKDLVEHTGSS